MPLSPENAALLQRRGIKTDWGGKIGSMLAEDLDAALHAARQEGERKALGAGPPTLRDHFAMAALPALLASLGGSSSVPAESRAAIGAYAVADAMLKERQP